jgi:two-component system, OmpR family, KDP operon response regulator KdpE
MRELKQGAALRRCLPISRFSARTGRMIVAGSCAQERKELRIALELEGHQVTEAETVEQTVEEACAGLHHALIVSSGFEGLESYELCRTIRRKSDLGIIVLAGEDIRQSRIDALNAGADDYLSSPFVLRELLARVRAVLRRVAQVDDGRNRIILHDRAIDLKSYKIRGPGSCVSHLTPKEFLVLQCLVAHAGKPFTHQSLAQTVWQRDGIGEVEFMRVVIRQLRRKLEPDPDNPRYILTERSVGYRFRMPPAPRPGAATELPALLSLAG